MDLFIIIVFLAGYICIIFEQRLKLNKAASSLITGGLCWLLLMMGSGSHSIVLEKLSSSLSETAGVLFFLLGAMTIVELIESHKGFDIITKRIKARNSRVLLWIIAWITFFLSAVLDNLTTAIVMIMLLRKLFSDPEDWLIFSGIIVIAANSGGAWSPIGDVTTTMLWIDERITAGNIILRLLLPSITNLMVPLILATFFLKPKKALTISSTEKEQSKIRAAEKNIVFFLGIGVLVSVPVFKILTGLPPYVGILIGLGVLWLVTEVIHKNKNDEEKMNFSVIKALKKMDMSTILFFLGILLAVSSLETAGILSKLAVWADQTFKSVIILGLYRLSFCNNRQCFPCRRINGNVPSFSLSNRPLFLGAHCLLHRDWRKHSDYRFGGRCSSHGDK